MLPVKVESKYKDLIYEQEETNRESPLERKSSTASYASYKTYPTSVVFFPFLMLNLYFIDQLFLFLLGVLKL